MKPTHIAFIGGGNMARSLIGGLIQDGAQPGSIRVSDPNEAQLQALAQQLGVETFTDNASAVAGAQVVVLAVKPQALGEVARNLAGAIQPHRPLIVSIAAGVRAGDLEAWLGGELPLVRTMPNTPSLVGSGATGLYANPRVDDRQRQMAESLLRAVGLTVWVDDEALLDAVTAVSGSGPAYFFLVMEALEEAGRQLGLEERTAHLLALQTAFGAAKMALESTEGPFDLRQRVTSPGGTTERAIQTLEDGGLRKLFATALKAAAERSRELGDLLGGH
ncbi:MAG: pyrroline-5-carboxylate reductase [Candidatus Competibacteraceae bacterium]|nr:pyrroline-5-carboxylate reductase [Candidatus Competibacteraceae bacterium]